MSCWIDPNYIMWRLPLAQLACHGMCLTHCSRVTHICINNLTIIGSDNGLSPGRCQVIIWTNDEMFSIQTLGKNFNEILIKFHIFSLKKMHLNMSSGNWWPFCLSINVLRTIMISRLGFEWQQYISFSQGLNIITELGCCSSSGPQ